MNNKSNKTDTLPIIGKATIKNLDALKEWNDSGEAVEFKTENWSEKRAKHWENSEQIGFYNLQNKIPQLNTAFDNVTGYHFTDLCDLAEFYNTLGRKLNLRYLDDRNRFAIVSGDNLDVPWLLPCRFLDVEMYKDYNAYSVAQIHSLGENSALLSPASMDQASFDDVTNDIEAKKSEIEAKKADMESLKREQEEKLEEFRKQLELQYKEKTDALQAMKANLDMQLDALNKKLYMIESEIYVLRCITGEVVNFVQLTSGQHADQNSPVVIYQKLRFLDEELGKFLAIYDYEGTSDEMRYFEKILKNREDMQELFCPGEKSVSFVKISRTGNSFAASPIFANVLDSYKKYHGSTIAILIRDGENLYIGWTDEDKIAIVDDNVFFAPQKETITQETEYATSSTQKEMLSRLFIFSVLQGLINDGKIIRLPQRVTVTKPSPYIVFSLADGWIEDNTYGSWEDILVSSKNEKISKGDMVLTMQRITRDDAGCYMYGRSTVNDSFNNDRGRGIKNRTHDVSIHDCTIYPINLVDNDDVWSILYLDYPYTSILHKDNLVKTERGESYTPRYEYLPLQGPPAINTRTKVIEGGKDDRFGKVTKDNIEAYIKWKDSTYSFDGKNNDLHREISSFKGGVKCYKRVFFKMMYIKTESHYFISEEKSDSGYDWRTGRDIKKARANMEVYKGEFLDLTYLDSVRVRYAITNRKLDGWKIGGKHIDFAKALEYLNKGLDYLVSREAEEKKMLLKYTDTLPDDWPALLSSWRHEKGYHAITDTRAKAFCKYIEERGKNKRWKD